MFRSNVIILGHVFSSRLPGIGKLFVNYIKFRNIILLLFLNVCQILTHSLYTDLQSSKRIYNILYYICTYLVHDEY